MGRGGRREDEVMKVVRKRRAVQQQPWPCSSFRLEPFHVLALAVLPATAMSCARATFREGLSTAARGRSGVQHRVTAPLRNPINQSIKTVFVTSIQASRSSSKKDAHIKSEGG